MGDQIAIPDLQGKVWTSGANTTVDVAELLKCADTLERAKTALASATELLTEISWSLGGMFGIFGNQIAWQGIFNGQEAEVSNQLAIFSDENFALARDIRLTGRIWTDHAQWLRQAALIYTTANGDVLSYMNICERAFGGGCSFGLTRSPGPWGINALGVSMLSIVPHLAIATGEIQGQPYEGLQTQLQMRTLSTVLTGRPVSHLLTKTSDLGPGYREVNPVTSVASAFAGLTAASRSGKTSVRVVGYPLTPLAPPDPSGASTQPSASLAGALFSRTVASASLRAAPVPTPLTGSQALARIGGIGAASPSRGQFEILRHQGGDGQQRSWSVVLRGTQEWDLGGTNPQDMLTNIEEIGGISSDQRQAITEAMQMAGVEPGEPVELIGHSQGGTVAVGLAADSEFTSQYSVVSVLTAGAPIGPSPVGKGIAMMNLENLSDLVPALDGAPPPHRAGGLTVQFDGRVMQGDPQYEVPATEADRGGPRPHSLGTYVGAARYLESAGQDDPLTTSAARWFDCRRERLGLDSGTVTISYLFDTERSQEEK